MNSMLVSYDSLMKDDSPRSRLRMSSWSGMPVRRLRRAKRLSVMVRSLGEPSTSWALLLQVVLLRRRVRKVSWKMMMARLMGLEL